MAFEFKIELLNVENPTVWRRVIVPSNFTFIHLHAVIQHAFGWEFSHMYEFNPDGYGSTPAIGLKLGKGMDMFNDAPAKDAAKTPLSFIFKETGQEFLYTYDMGDDWMHLITLEKIIEDEVKWADCIDGAGACPPEDSGGPWTYDDLKMSLTDPSHPDYADRREWLGLEEGEIWDAERFDLKEASKHVKSIKAPASAPKAKSQAKTRTPRKKESG